MINIIHPYDLLRLFEKLKEQSAGRLLSRILASKKDRVKSTWKHTTSDVRSWTEIPAVQKRINKKISGHENIDHFTYTAQKHFRDDKKRTALSIGCGAGGKEICWAKTGSFVRIDAFDISAPRIEAAMQKSKAEHLESTLHFNVGDVRSVLTCRNTYDVIIAEGILHHLTPLNKIIPSMKSLLSDDGLLIVNDYVGPSRFQWTQKQLDAANDLLSTFPTSCKTQYNGFPKNKIHRPGLLTMYLYDPSEAVESEQILKCTEQYFSIIEKKEYGGTLLHLLFKDIAHHFVEPDGVTSRILNTSFSTEDELLSNNSLKSDFVFLICKKK